MGDEDDAHPFRLQVPHQAKELHHLLLVQGGGGLIQNEHLTLHIYRPGNGHHLLHGDGAGAQLLIGAGRDTQGLQNFSRAAVHGLPVGHGPLGSADVHILRHRQVGAQGDLLIDSADTRVLGVLGRADDGSAVDSRDVDLSPVLGVHAGEHLDQRGFPRAVLPHQGVDLALTQGEIRVLKGAHTRKVFVFYFLIFPELNNTNYLIYPLLNEYKSQLFRKKAVIYCKTVNHAYFFSTFFCWETSKTCPKDRSIYTNFYRVPVLFRQAG